MDKKPHRGTSLTWKFEEPSGGGSLDDDLGPAWVDSDDQSSYPSGAVSRGKWMTRREARAFAEEHGFTFLEDDGRSSISSSQIKSGLDVAEINRRLRAAGISETELKIEESGFGDVKVWGTMLQSLPNLARDPGSPFVTAMVSMSPDEALDAVDQLVPNWESIE